MTKSELRLLTLQHLCVGPFIKFLADKIENELKPIFDKLDGEEGDTLRTALLESFDFSLQQMSENYKIQFIL